MNAIYGNNSEYTGGDMSAANSGLDLPKSAQIEVTNKCNLRCQMCPLSDDDYKPVGKRSNLSLQDFNRILEKLPPTIESISLQGLGEPMLNRELFEIIRHARGKGKAVSFFTNATLLTEENAHKICESDLTHLMFSLDGGTKLTFERIRNGANFESVVENIKTLSRVKSELRATSPALGIMVVGMKENILEVPRIIDIAAEAGIPSVTVKNLFPDEGIAGTPLDRGDIAYLETTCASYAIARGITFSHPQDAGYDNLSSERTCRWLWDTTYVTADGFVTPCCFSYEGNFPNLRDTPFETIWNSGLHHEFREELLHGIPELCRKCPAYSSKMVTYQPDQ